MRKGQSQNPVMMRKVLLLCVCEFHAQVYISSRTLTAVPCASVMEVARSNRVHNLDTGLGIGHQNEQQKWETDLISIFRLTNRTLLPYSSSDTTSHVKLRETDVESVAPVLLDPEFDVPDEVPRHTSFHTVLEEEAQILILIDLFEI